MRSVLEEDDLNAAVGFAVAGGVVGEAGAGFAQTSGGDAVWRDGLSDEVGADAEGTALGEAPVVVFGAFTVGVACDVYADMGVLVEEGGKGVQ